MSFYSFLSQWMVCYTILNQKEILVTHFEKLSHYLGEEFKNLENLSYLYKAMYLLRSELVLSLMEE